MEKRLDIVLVEQGLAPSREKAKELLKNAQVTVDGVRIQKPAFLVNENARVAVTGEVNPYVSRGGLKLKKAIDTFHLDMTGKTCLDIGASTGGFTDCMLQHGAGQVAAIDVGTDQLVEKLKNDPRVTSLEQTNIRALTLNALIESTGWTEPADFASVDVSFISLDKVLPTLLPLLKDDGMIVCLIKPQFEAGRAALNKKGIVKDPKVHEKVLRNILQLAASLSLSVEGLTYSPIRGPEGNIEYLILLQKTLLQETAGHKDDARLSETTTPAPSPFDLAALVKVSHQV